MKIYAIGRMSKGTFVTLAGALGIRDAAQAESMLRLQGKRGLKIAELESVATFEAEDGFKYERVLTPRAEERIRLGEYKDGEGLTFYAVGLIGVPYVEEVETDWLTDMFYGTDFYPTLRKAWTARTAEVNGAGEEEPWDYRVYEMRVLAWIAIDDDLKIVRTPVGPETPLEDEYVRRREPLPPPPEEDYYGITEIEEPAGVGEPDAILEAIDKPRGTSLFVSIAVALGNYGSWLEESVLNFYVAVFEKQHGREPDEHELRSIEYNDLQWAMVMVVLLHALGIVCLPLLGMGAWHVLFA